MLLMRFRTSPEGFMQVILFITSLRIFGFHCCLNCLVSSFHYDYREPNLLDIATCVL